MVSPIYQRTSWKYMTGAITIIMIAAATIELLFGQVLTNFFPSTMIDFVEVIFALILILDLGLQFSDAKNRYSFIRSNMLKIIAVLPFTMIFKAARFIQFQKVAMIRTGEWFLGLATWDEFIWVLKSRLFTAFRIRF